MWKNTCNQVSYPSFLENKEWNTSLNWASVPEETQNFSLNYLQDERCFVNDFSLSAQRLRQYEREAEEGIAQISDPLWRRICIDVLRTLGPVAFQDLWKTQLVTVSSEGRRAYLVCSDSLTAKIIEQYHFVIIEALKQYYPFLSTLEIEISDNT